MEGGEGELIQRVMLWRRKAVTKYYYRLRGGKDVGEWWEQRIGRVEDTTCPRFREEEDKWDHIVFRCRKTRRIKHIQGRREWIGEKGMRWECWECWHLRGG